MNSLGIYFGPKAISMVETEKKKVKNHNLIPQAAVYNGELDKKVPAEVKTIEIIALLKDELRRNKMDAREATICLSGRDLIIRTFQMPVLPRQEMQSAINFEAKKYIPFKIEEVIADFQIKLDRLSHTSLVLYIGIKKETLDRHISILNQLDLKINAVEYSAFSILRCLKLAGLNGRGVVGVLAADLKVEDEINFMVLEDGFPLNGRIDFPLRSFVPFHRFLNIGSRFRPFQLQAGHAQVQQGPPTDSVFATLLGQIQRPAESFPGIGKLFLPELGIPDGHQDVCLPRPPPHFLGAGQGGLQVGQRPVGLPDPDIGVAHIQTNHPFVHLAGHLVRIPQCFVIGLNGPFRFHEPNQRRTHVVLGRYHDAEVVGLPGQGKACLQTL